MDNRGYDLPMLQLMEDTIFDCNPIFSLDYPRQFNYQTIFIYFLFIWFGILNSMRPDYITSSAVYSRVTQTAQ